MLFVPSTISAKSLRATRVSCEYILSLGGIIVQPSLKV